MIYLSLHQQPPHHPHHPWMMNPYARNRRGSFIDAQILPSSVHYGRSPSLHMDKHKVVSCSYLSTIFS